MELRTPLVAEEATIHALLAANGLPTEDLAHAKAEFVVALEEGDVL